MAVRPQTEWHIGVDNQVKIQKIFEVSLPPSWYFILARRAVKVIMGIEGIVVRKEVARFLLVIHKLVFHELRWYQGGRLKLEEDLKFSEEAQNQTAPQDGRRPGWLGSLLISLISPIAVTRSTQASSGLLEPERCLAFKCLHLLRKTQEPIQSVMLLFFFFLFTFQICFIFSVIKLDGSVPVKYGLRLNADDKYSALKSQLSHLCGTPAHLLKIAEVAQAQIKASVK